MWDSAEDIYEYVARNDIYVEDLDIQLHVYTFPMTSNLLAYCKENSYRIDISEDTILEFPHFDFTYTDIDSMEWVSNCTEETSFSVGTCAAAGFNFSIFSEKYLDDGSNVTYDTTEFKRAVVIPVYDFCYGDNLIAQKQLGVFHVSDYEKDTDKIDFTCLDNMQFFDKKAKGIQKYISVPLKSNALFGQILKKLNLAEGPVPAGIKYFQVNQVEHLKKLTYRTIISYAMEAIGAYAYANSIGEISYKCFYVSSDPVATILYEDIMEEKRKGNGVKINGYDIQYGDNAISAFSYAAGEEEVEVPVPLTVDNPLFIKKKQESLDTIGKRIFDRMYGFSFDPYEVTAFLPNFYIEAGDFVNIEDKYGEIHKILVSQLTWRDNLEMEIVSAYETGETDSDYDSDVNEAIQRNGNIDSIPSDDDSEEEPDVIFSFTGEQFNSAIKNMMSSSEVYYSSIDSVTKKILFSEKAPSEYASEGDLGSSITIEKIELDGETYEFTVFTTVSESSSGTVRMYSNTEKVKLSNNMSSMFYNFTKLTSLDVSRFDTSNVTSMSFMFENCKYLTTLDLLNFDTSNVVLMSNMFAGCEKLISLNVNLFNTSKTRYMSYMFNYCSNLPTLNLSSFDTSNVTTMAGMFSYCSKLSLISVTESKWVINDDTDIKNMFTGAGCSDVTYV